MKLTFYPKLAWEGIRKNKRLYVPYLLTGTVMVMMYYIMSFLAQSEMLEHMKGGGVLRTMLPLGCIVIAFFAFIFLFYSNSVLIRQRNREFGLYNILGMDKQNLSIIMLWENGYAAIIAILCGLGTGVILSKLAELCMVNLIEEEISYSLYIDMGSIRETALLFLGIYALLLINSVVKVCKSNPLALLRSSDMGEKAPKANWLMAVLGVLILAAAYYIAVSVEEPMTAMLWFFVAVLMVIIATYLLFLAGSVALCRLLQKNKRYYYKPNHFVSVSSMVYRMKRNGAGLASICILLTMVLVMLSSTLSLYIGAEDSLALRYPYDISLLLFVPEMEQFTQESFSQMRKGVTDRVPKQQNVLEYACAEVPGLFTDDGFLIDYESHQQFAIQSYNRIGYLEIISLEDYNRLMGRNETLESGECLIVCYQTEYNGETFSIEEGEALRIKNKVEDMWISGYAAASTVPYMWLITPEFHAVVDPLLDYTNQYGQPYLDLKWNYSFDMEAVEAEQIAAYDLLRNEIDDYSLPHGDGSYSYNIECREIGRSDFYGLYGGLLFIGVLLSFVFLFAAVLIIYYKQISEGLEDQKRFAVMQKVGMTKRDIRKTINSQVLTVFFAPLLMAGIHLAFAFPLVWKLLQLFNISNIILMIVVTGCCFLIFGVAYALVYKITSNAYFSIVSGAKDE